MESAELLLGWKVLHIDDFLEKDKGRYVDHLRHAEFREAVRNTTRRVCMLAVARVCSFTDGLKIRRSKSWAKGVSPTRQKTNAIPISAPQTT